MNITDIDDKIIRRARQNYLYEQYTGKTKTEEEILTDYAEILTEYEVKMKINTDPDKGVMMKTLMEKVIESSKQYVKAIHSKDRKQIDDCQKDFLVALRDPLSEWLDQKDGASVTDNSIFESLPRFWENEFHKDMKSLNVLEPDVLTRVSEYVPQIVTFIEKIIENGLAYNANGSVYFDVAGFDAKDKHFYAKLVPEAYGDMKSLIEGEGDLTATPDQLSEKKSPNDFALWKSSKAGEPFWVSPWGNGRPGWHIECSAMAADICGSTLDIHTGGVDLKFPHHDNEMAQTEAHYGCDDWVKYFLHTGHLTISGCKMSKSLKNFVTIQQALEKHSATQLRLAFLLHSWKDTLDYSENTMEMAMQFEKCLNEFFLNIKDLTRSATQQFDPWTTNEGELQQKFNSSKSAIHVSLCDNVDTRSVLDNIRDLVSSTNVYIKNNGEKLNRQLMKKIAIYITDILYVFGAINGPRGGIGFPVGDSNESDFEQKIMPFVSTLSDFRSSVRKIARDVKATEILQLCDSLRDDILPNLGVRLEDRETGPSAVKLVDKNVLLKERETKRALEDAKAAEKEAKRIQTEAAQALKDAQKKINPVDMFKSETDKYSAFDDKGMPTHDVEGKELSKGQLKKLQKLHAAQEKKYNEYLATLDS